MRYGMRKATMGDIADFAGVSRQTLYSSFANKSDAFVAAVECIASEIKTDIQERWADDQSMEEKLDIYFQRAVISVFEMICNTPDAGDMMNGFDKQSSEVIREAERSKLEMLHGLFLPYEHQLKERNLSAYQIAELCERSGSSFLRIAADMTELERLVSTLKRSILALLKDA